MLTISSNSLFDFTISTGTQTDLGSDMYLIEGIDINTNLTIVYSLLDLDCGDVLIVNPPQCGCGEVNPPISVGNEIICFQDEIPQLEVTVDSGQTALWYSDQLLTNLITTGTTYLPTQAGTYYVITEEISTGCQSTMVTEVTLSIVILPNIVGFNQDCSDDLLEYTVTFDLSDNQDVTVSASEGQLSVLSGSSYEISGISSNLGIVITVSSDLANCTSPISFPAPNCNCPTLQPPVNDALVEYCTGEPIPTLSAVTANNFETYWYSDVTLTQLLSTDNLYTPASPGIFYITTYDLASDCQSIASEVALIENPLPDLTNFIAYCDESDPNSYIVEITQTNDNMIQFNAGSPTTSDGSFFIINSIPIGTDLIVSLTHTFTTCENTILIPSPDCACIDPVLVDITLPDNICIGDDIILEATGTGFTDTSWQSTGDGTFANQFDLNTAYTPGSNDIAIGSVTFEFTAEDPDGSGPCQEVTITETVTISAQPDQPSVNQMYNLCVGGTVNLNSLIGAGYNWYDSDMNSLLQEPTINTIQAGQVIYFISQTVDGCESGLLQLEFNINEILINYFTVSPCEQTDLGEIVITEFIGAGNEYNVTANGIQYLITDSDLPFVITYPLDTQISLDVSDELGCNTMITTQDEINVLSNTSATIIQSQIDLNTFSLSFDVDLPLDQIESISWGSTGGFISCIDCVTTEISITQNENVGLVITTIEGCTISVGTILIFEAPDIEEEVFIPNIFKPGSGDENSMFYPQSTADLGLLDRLSIYDRWGTLIYTTVQQQLNNPSIGWDGTYNGNVVEQGVYIYLIEVTMTQSGETELFAGDVTVVR